MNDSDSDSDSDDDHDDRQLRDDDDYDDDYIVDKLNTILQRKGEFSLRSRSKINELAREFLENLGSDIHDMLCDDDVEADDYFGLDSNRDTEAEIETALRFFPELLSRRKKATDGATHRNSLYPVELLVYTRSGSNIWKCNLAAVSFVPLVVRLAIEFDLFEEHERGGLLIRSKYDNNMLKLLSSTHNMVASDRDNHELIDDAHLNVMVQLRQMGHFKKEDIYIHGLLRRMCHQSIFPGKRFQFLVEWYPIALIRPNESGYVPLHFAAILSSSQAFQAVFEYGIRYFPKKKGISLLFMKNMHRRTPIQKVFCRKTELRDEVMTVIEDTLTRYSSFSDNNDTSINTVEALVMAAIDENIHLNCVYFLLRRQPDVLVELLSSTPTPTPGEAAGSNNNNNNNNEDDDDNDYDDGGDEWNDGNNDILVRRRMLSSNKKRKRRL